MPAPPPVEKHLAGLHEGALESCAVKCARSSCGHACPAHPFGLKCTHPGCDCPGLARPAAIEDVRQHLVSCLMVTRASRVEMAMRAIRCFEAQTYPWKELVIVSDDDLSMLGRPYLRVPAGLKLGDLRNMSIAASLGAYVAQWDDDDWYHPERLSLQMRLLRESPDADGCTLGRWMMAWPERSLFGVSEYRATGWEGSIVARRYRIPCYPSIARGEDIPVIENMKLVVLDDPNLYIYTVHGTNTWDVPHFEMMFERKNRGASEFERRQILERLNE